MEKRILAAPFMRAVENGKSKQIAGYAARYNVLSHSIRSEGNEFKERIAPGAFDRILRTKPDVVATFNHNNNFVLGRTSSGTLRLRSDASGLAFDCDLPNTTYAKDLYESIKRGDVSGASFAFKLGPGDDIFKVEDDEDDDSDSDSKILVRTINNFSGLYDISCVVGPAYPGTVVDVRHDLITAEMRSRIQQILTPKPRSRRNHGEAGGEISLEHAIEIRDARRKSLIDAVLD